MAACVVVSDPVEHIQGETVVHGDVERGDGSVGRRTSLRFDAPGLFGGALSVPVDPFGVTEACDTKSEVTTVRVASVSCYALELSS